jgi:hypothetical protein
VKDGRGLDAASEAVGEAAGEPSGETDPEGAGVAGAADVDGACVGAGVAEEPHAATSSMAASATGTTTALRVRAVTGSGAP